MLKEEKDLGMDVTVNEAEIEDCLEKAGEMEAKIEKRNEDHLGEEYYIYEPEVKKEKHQITEG
jgi:hypothetical protein